MQLWGYVEARKAERRMEHVKRQQEASEKERVEMRKQIVDRRRAQRRRKQLAEANAERCRAQEEERALKKTEKRSILEMARPLARAEIAREFGAG